MPKMLIISACLVNYADDKGGIAHDAGEFVEVAKETAKTLVDHGRALYCAKADDPDKAGVNTATDAMIKAAEAAAKSDKKA